MTSAAEQRMTVAHPQPCTVPLLETGDHLDQKTFHARYESMSDDVRAELIGGVVYMSAALKRPHGRLHSLLNFWLCCYEEQTSGVEVYDNATTIMGEQSEPQPDLSMIILPECGGQTRITEDDYLMGAPELVAEVASSTESIDLHAKKRDYERTGVKEYLVVALRQRNVFWFVHQTSGFTELAAGRDDILRSTYFPGLWLDPAALLGFDRQRLIHVLRQGLETPDHGEFAKKLKAKK